MKILVTIKYILDIDKTMNTNKILNYLILAGLKVLALFLFICPLILYGQTLDNNGGWVFANDYEHYKLLNSTGAIQLGNSKFSPIDVMGPDSNTTVNIESTPEIENLARALFHDPKRIYHYVRNKIDFVPYFGYLKGPLTTFNDRSGNDFDQAALLIALLRASGYEADFIYGTMDIPISGGDDNHDLQHWLRVEPNVEAVIGVLSNGGFPINIANPAKAIPRIWVRAKLDNETYELDPAFKLYRETESVDLKSAINFVHTDLLESLTGESSNDTIQNIDSNSVKNKLVEYSTKLIEYLRTNHANTHIDEILGSAKIVEDWDSFPKTIPFPTSTISEWTNIPQNYVHRMGIIFSYQPGDKDYCSNCANPTGFDVTLNIPNIAGKLLSLDFGSNVPNKSNTPAYLRLDGIIVATDTGQIDNGGNYNKLTITIDHPYLGLTRENNYLDNAWSDEIIRGSTYVIATSWGGGDKDELLYRREQLHDKILKNSFHTANSELQRESLNIIGQTWFHETALTSKLLQKLVGFNVVTHHRVSLVSQNDHYHIETPLQSFSGYTRNGTPPDFDSFAPVVSLLMTALNQGVLEQTQNSKAAESTTEIINTALDNDEKLFLISKSNYVHTIPKLVGYDADFIDELNSIFSKLNESNGDSKIIVLPENKLSSVSNRNNFSSIEYSSLSGDRYFNAYIGEQVNAASVSQPGNINPEYMKRSYFRSIRYAPGHLLARSRNGVDQLTGSFEYTHNDLLMGPSIPSLSLHRSYSTHNLSDTQLFGTGWKADFEYKIKQFSAETEMLGNRSAVDAAAVIVAAIVQIELLKRNRTNIENWTLGTIVSNWLADQLNNGGVSVNHGHKLFTYIRLPDGNFNPPPGVTTKLELIDGNFLLRDRNGKTIQFDDNDKVKSVSDIHGNEVNYAYDNGLLTEIRSNNNHHLNFIYQGNKVVEIRNNTGRKVGYNYTGDQLTSFINVEGNTWHYQYDNDSQLVSIRNPLGIDILKNEYDSLGKISRQIFPRQNGESVHDFYYAAGHYGGESINEKYDYTTYFDDNNLTIALEDPLGHVSRFEYNGQYLPTVFVNEHDVKVSLEYDTNQNIISIMDQSGNKISFEYDMNNHLVKVVDPLSNVIRFNYDDKHHPVKLIDQWGFITALSYTPNGRLAARTNPTKTIFGYDYNNFGYMQQTSVSNHPETIISNNPLGQILNLKDQVKSDHKMRYNLHGYTTKHTDPLGRETTLEYDNINNLNSLTDRNKDHITFGYSDTGKVKNISYPDNSVVQYSYDINDRLSSVKDLIGTSTYTYDSVGQINSIKSIDGFDIGYEYDSIGNTKKITYPSSNNKEISLIYKYDHFNRMTSAKNWLGQESTYEYDITGKLLKINHFNGTSTRYAYDISGDIVSIENKNSENIIHFQIFDRDENGNILREVREQPQAFDDSNLTSVEYTYNNKKNRLLSILGSQNENYSYDKQGQLIDVSNKQKYEYDFEHRLTKLIDSSLITKYRYDGLGNRISVEKNGAVIKFIYGANGNLLAETDANGNITKYYIYGHGLQSMIENNQSFEYHFNYHGSTIAITDKDQNIINQYNYSPYGIVLGKTESINQPFKYSARWGVIADTSGLYYMKSRYYDPTVGRFITPNPIGINGGINLYTYVGGNPIDEINPSGLYLAENKRIDVAGLNIAKQTIRRYLGDFSIPFSFYAFNADGPSGIAHEKGMIFGCCVGMRNLPSLALSKRNQIKSISDSHRPWYEFRN